MIGGVHLSQIDFEPGDYLLWNHNFLNNHSHEKTSLVQEFQPSLHLGVDSIEDKQVHNFLSKDL